MEQKKKQFRVLSKVIVLSLIVLFCMLPLINTNSIVTNFMKLFKASDEVELDNWEISTVFYDSTVNDGKTPLTEINWVEPEDNKDGATRTIIVQINYKNTNVTNEYHPRSLKISLPNILSHYRDANWNVTNGWSDRTNSTMTIGANDLDHSGYEWTFKNGKTRASYSDSVLEFYNTNLIEKHANLEGSIQIQYSLTPQKEQSTYNSFPYVESYDDECIHSFEENIKAKLRIVDSYEIEANDLNFSYYKKYIHPWTKMEYSIKEEISKPLGYDNLIETDNYYWVKYDFSINDQYNWVYTYRYYPNITADKLVIKNNFLTDVLILDSSYNKIEPDEENNYSFKINGYSSSQDPPRYKTYIFVGYPKHYFDDESKYSISNKVDLYVKFLNGEEYEYQSTDTVSFDLRDYLLGDIPDKYTVEKRNNAGSGSIEKGFTRFYGKTNLYYEGITGVDDKLPHELKSEITFSSIFNGLKYDLKIGDDLLFITDKNGDIRKLNDNEYKMNYFKIPDSFYDINGILVPKDKIEIDIYTRYRDEEEYVLNKTVNNIANDKSSEIYFEGNKDVVGFYALIKNLNISVINNYSKRASFYVNISINTKNLQENTGQVYNACYVDAIRNNQFINNVSQDSYNSFMKSYLTNYDLTNYGHYMQRSINSVEYYNFSINHPTHYFRVKKEMDNVVQNVSKEQFEGKTRLNMVTTSADHRYNYNEHELNNYVFDIEKEKWNDGFELFDLLPLGMELDSSKEEIIESLSDSFANYKATKLQRIITYDGRIIIGDDLIDFFRDNISVKIIRNWKNTNRTYIYILVDFSDNPVIFQDIDYNLTSDSAHYHQNAYTLTYKWHVSYDYYIEFGNNWTNTVYYRYYNHDFSYGGTSSDLIFAGSNFFDYYDEETKLLKYCNEKTDMVVQIYGGSENDWIFNSSGMVNNRHISFNYSSTTFNFVVSTNQDVQVSVQSDKSNYDTGIIDTSTGSEYFYKLRVRTGTNDVTNLVIYDSLEKYAKDSNMQFIDPSYGYRRWYGEFLGVDTSVAESKGYNVVVYYSESSEPGSLKTDNGWHEYNESVDKSKVKSLAFKYLDSDGKPAIIPANSTTFVLIKMRSPEDDSIKALAYNGCWTEWNAIDSLTGEIVDFITGINSNNVKVALPNSVEPVDIDFKVDKYWNDNNNELRIRPESINLQLVPDGDVAKAIDVPLGNTNVDSNNSNHWTTTISVPKYDYDGNIIAYTLREDEIRLSNGYKYTPEINDNSITNKLVKEITLKKRWIDNNNSYLTRPGNVTYMLKQNGSDYKEVVITGDYSTNEWTKIVTVPVYDSSNNKYNYSIEEYEIQNYVGNCNDYTCTNTLTASDSINVSKEWKDNNNSYGTRPNSITIHLLRNGVQYKNVILNGNNNWNSNAEIDKYDSNGREYVYTISEDEIDEYGLVTYDQNNYKVTNTLKTNTNITITKKWIDDSNSNNTRPSELRITLLRNGENYRELTLSGDSDIWTSTIEVPKYDDNQIKYKYTIKEINDDISDEYSDITYSEDELTVTNKLNKNTDLTIKKKWVDSNNEYSSRPSEVNISLLRDGDLFKELTLTGNSDTWENIVKDVPVYDENGRKYNYTIREDNINRYEKVTYDQTNLEVTNELTEIPTVTLYFTVVNGYVDPKTGKMKYDEFGLNEVLEKYNVSPDDEYIFKFKLENTDTHKTYDGKLSTKGILEFKDIPYGDYKAVVGKDKLFEFVDMLSIKEVNGVSFKKIGKEGYISIKPTGENIIFGAKIINKIVPPIANPKTGINIIFIIVLVLLIPIIVSKIVTKNRKVLDSY